LLLKILLRDLAQLLLETLLLLLDMLSLSLLLLEHVLGLLGLHTGILALLVVLSQILLSLFLFLDHLSGDVVKFAILGIDRVYKFLVLLHIFNSTILNLLENLDIFLLDLLLF
jgi:hypothetical protein